MTLGNDLTGSYMQCSVIILEDSLNSYVVSNIVSRHETVSVLAERDRNRNHVGDTVGDTTSFDPVTAHAVDTALSNTLSHLGRHSVLDVTSAMTTGLKDRDQHMTSHPLAPCRPRPYNIDLRYCTFEKTQGFADCGIEEDCGSI